jgi:hypothetical protein
VVAAPVEKEKKKRSAEVLEPKKPAKVGKKVVAPAAPKAAAKKKVVLTPRKAVTKPEEADGGVPLLGEEDDELAEEKAGLEAQMKAATADEKKGKLAMKKSKGLGDDSPATSRMLAAAQAKDTLTERLEAVSAERKKRNAGNSVKMLRNMLLGKKMVRKIKKAGKSDGSDLEEDEESEAESSGDSEKDFGAELGAGGKHREIMKMHQRRPGKLGQSGLRLMAGFLEERTGESREEKLPAVALKYLLMVLIPARAAAAGKDGERLSPGMIRQLRTVATAIDMLVRGRQLESLDVLVQRYKALEMSLQDGGWSNAQHLELLPKTTVSITSRPFGCRPRTKRSVAVAHVLSCRVIPGLSRSPSFPAASRIGISTSSRYFSPTAGSFSSLISPVRSPRKPAIVLSPVCPSFPGRR